MQHLIGEEKGRTVVGAVLSLFLLVTKRLYGKEREWSIGQIKTCRKKQHVKIDNMKEMSDLICGKAAVGGNYNSTHDNVEYVINCLGKNTTKVRNIKSYLLASLFNAGSTISSYYRAEVNHDMPQFAG